MTPEEKESLRKQIADCFDESELRNLCFGLGNDYQKLPGQHHGDKVRELISYYERRSRLPELLAACYEKRPAVNWQVTFPLSPQNVRTGYPAIRLAKRNVEEISRLDHPFAVKQPLADVPSSPSKKYITLSFIVILALVGFIFARPLLNQTNIIVLQEEPYHIGDVGYKSVVQNGILIGTTPYAHPAPQPNPFEASFVVHSTPSKVILHLTARDVDPDEKISPVQIRINEYHSAYLNEAFFEETMEPRAVSIQLDPRLIQIGQNVLTIYVEPSNLEYGIENLDDIEFWDVKIEIH